MASQWNEIRQLPAMEIEDAILDHMEGLVDIYAEAYFKMGCRVVETCMQRGTHSACLPMEDAVSRPRAAYVHRYKVDKDARIPFNLLHKICTRLGSVFKDRSPCYCLIRIHDATVTNPGRIFVDQLVYF